MNSEWVTQVKLNNLNFKAREGKCLYGNIGNCNSNFSSRIQEKEKEIVTALNYNSKQLFFYLNLNGIEQ